MINTVISWVGEHLINTDTVKNYLVSMVIQYPWGALFIVAVAGLRGAMKPFMLYLENLVNKSGNQKLIEQLNSIEQGKILKFVNLFLDYFTSIKLDVVQQAVAVSKSIKEEEKSVTPPQ